MNHCHLANVVHKWLDDIFVGFHIIGLFWLFDHEMEIPLIEYRACGR